MIELPIYAWFFSTPGGEVCTNTLSGSFGTDEKSGSVNRTLFHYSIFVRVDDKKGEQKVTCATCEWRAPWNQGGDVLCAFSEEFSGDEAGVIAAKEWVEERYASTNPNE